MKRRQTPTRTPGRQAGSALRSHPGVQTSTVANSLTNRNCRPYLNKKKLLNLCFALISTHYEKTALEPFSAGGLANSQDTLSHIQRYFYTLLTPLPPPHTQSETDTQTPPQSEPGIILFFACQTFRTTFFLFSWQTFSGRGPKKIPTSRPPNL